jgi:ketosteroid isomerase-like protein
MPPQPSTAGSAGSADEAAIRSARAAQTAALALGDLDAVARHWTPDVTIRRALGHAIGNAEEARQVLQPVATAGQASPLLYQRHTLAVQVSPHWPLAWEDGRWSGHAGAASSPAVMSGRYAAQWVRRDGRWLIRSEVFVALDCQGPGCQAQALA